MSEVNSQKKSYKLLHPSEIWDWYKSGDRHEGGGKGFVSFPDYEKLQKENERKDKLLAEFVYCEENPNSYKLVEEIEKENVKTKSLLDRFCTKSNALSMYFRATWRPEKLKENIENMYDLQCEAESYLQGLNKK